MAEQNLIAGRAVWSMTIGFTLAALVGFAIGALAFNHGIGGLITPHKG